MSRSRLLQCLARSILQPANPWLEQLGCCRQAAVPLLHQQMHWSNQQCPWQQQWQHSASTAAAAAAASRAPSHYTRLMDLTPVPGAARDAIRWGRGNGGGRGTYCGRGIKGQKSRKGNKPHLLYDGGQKQLRKFPKVHIKASSPVAYQPLHLDRLASWVAQGRLDPDQVITMKDLRDSGCIPKRVRWGVQLLSRGAAGWSLPLQLQVSAADPEARAAVEGAGGRVTTVYYSQLGLRALLKPEAFIKKGRQIPRPVRACPPRDKRKFEAIGDIPGAGQRLLQQQAAAGACQASADWLAVQLVPSQNV